MDYRVWILPILLILLLGGYYFGKKLMLLFSLKNRKQKLIYWGILYFILTVILTRRSCLLIWIGYAIFFYVIFDLIFLISKKCNKEKVLKKIYCKGIPILLFSMMILIYGVYNASHPILKKYEVTFPVSFDYKIAMISDLHLGTIHGEAILDEIVEKANSLEIDLFIMAGDIFDEQTSSNLKEKAYQKLSTIKTKYGIYYVEGNHDLLASEVEEGFLQNGIQVLSDKEVLINEEFYLVGRKDKRREELGTPRKNLKELLSDIDSHYPIILVDHQPIDQKLASSFNVHLHLSGHTHAGQIFPLNFVMQYGYYEKENYHSIVSSGYGAWGFPFRTAGKSEMVLIQIKKEK